MLNFGNKEFRNIQEQVLKNANDIKEIKDVNTLLANFGIKVVGDVEDASLLPDASTYDGQFGDAYSVGLEAPYDYYIFTRANDETPVNHWFFIGKFPAVGPQGPKGDKGDKGDRGETTKWYVGTNPSYIVQPKIDDMFLDGEGGNVFQYNEYGWYGVGNIKGPRGATGPKGDIGPAGPQGPQGPQGEQGVAGSVANIIGQVATENDLPSPSLMPQGSGYLVGSHIPYDLYVILSGTNQWFNVGPFGNMQVVELPSGSSSGVITESDLARIQATQFSAILLDNELYFLSDDQQESGYMVFSHVGQDNTQDVYIKTIAITLSTLGWIRISNKVVSTAAQNVFTVVQTFSAGAKIGNNNVIETDAYNNLEIITNNGTIKTNSRINPTGSTMDLGSTDNQWRDLYLSASVHFKGETTDCYITNYSNALGFYQGTNRVASLSTGGFYPVGTTRNLGATGQKWQNIYLSGNSNYYNSTNNFYSIKNNSDTVLEFGRTYNNVYQKVLALDGRTLILVSGGDLRIGSTSINESQLQQLLALLG